MAMSDITTVSFQIMLLKNFVFSRTAFILVSLYREIAIDLKRSRGRASASLHLVYA